MLEQTISSHKEINVESELPNLFAIIALDSIVTRTSFLLNKDVEVITDDLKMVLEKLLCIVLQLIEVYQSFARYVNFYYVE